MHYLSALPRKEDLPILLTPCFDSSSQWYASYTFTLPTSNATKRPPSAFTTNQSSSELKLYTRKFPFSRPPVEKNFFCFSFRYITQSLFPIPQPFPTPPPTPYPSGVAPPSALLLNLFGSTTPNAQTAIATAPAPALTTQ